MNKNMLFISLLCILSSVYSFINGMIAPQEIELPPQLPIRTDVRVKSILALDEKRSIQYHETENQKIKRQAPVRSLGHTVMRIATGQPSKKQPYWFAPAFFPLNTIEKNGNQEVNGLLQVGYLLNANGAVVMNEIGTFTKKGTFVESIEYDGVTRNYAPHSCYLVPITIKFSTDPRHTRSFGQLFEQMKKDFMDDPIFIIKDESDEFIERITQQQILEPYVNSNGDRRYMPGIAEYGNIKTLKRFEGDMKASGNLYRTIANRNMGVTGRKNIQRNGLMRQKPLTSTTTTTTTTQSTTE